MVRGLRFRVYYYGKIGDIVIRGALPRLRGRSGRRRGFDRFHTLDVALVTGVVEAQTEICAHLR